MKVAFWSNASAKCGVSANLAAVSVASVIRYPYTIVTMENHLSNHNLGQTYLGTNHPTMVYEVGSNYYDGGGIEGLLRKIYRGIYPSGILKSYLKEVISEHLYYIPQSKVIHNEIFDYEFNHCMKELFHLVEEYSDICFIDTAYQNTYSSNAILEEADLIVVNLCQNPIILEDFFLNHNSLSSKSIYLIGNYNYHTNLSSRCIAKMYEIPRESILSIPSNEEFNNSIQKGSIVEFISSNYSCGMDNCNYLFIQAVKKASNLIIKQAEHLCKSKELQMDSLVDSEAAKVLSLCGR